MNSISEYIFNVFKGNDKLLCCNTRKLRKNKVTLLKVADKGLFLSSKKKLIVQRGGFLLPLISAVPSTIPSLIFSPR